MTTHQSILIPIVLSLLFTSGDLMAQSGSRPTKSNSRQTRATARPQQPIRSQPKPGIAGEKAPAWKVSEWHQLPEGEKSLNVADYKGKVLYLYFFQSWCPGCHKVGFPTLQKVQKEFEGDDSVAFVAIQTTFEGHSVNTADKLEEVASRYKLDIPFGQSAGTRGTPDIMKRYRTGGTPWVVIIDTKGRVVFNDYRVDADRAIAGIRKLSEQGMQKTRSVTANYR